MEDHEKISWVEKLFACSKCIKSFPENGVLKRNDRIHTGEKPFPFPIFEKKFAHNHSLKTQENVHTGGKSFACSFCDKPFTQSHGRSLKGMKGSMEEKSFSCCKCDKAFLREVVKRGPKEFSLCLNSKSIYITLRYSLMWITSVSKDYRNFFRD